MVFVFVVLYCIFRVCLSVLSLLLLALLFVCFLFPDVVDVGSFGFAFVLF